MDAECVSGTCSGHASSRRGLDAHREELVHIFEQPTLGRLGLVRRRLQERSWTGRALVLHGRGGWPTLGGGEKPVYCTPQLPVFGDLRRRPQGLANGNGGPVSHARQHTLGVVLKVVYRCVFKVYCRRVLLRRQDVGVIGHVSAHSAVCGY